MRHERPFSRSRQAGATKKAGRWFPGSGAVGMSGGDLATRAPTLGPHRGSRADPKTVAVLAWKLIVVSQPCTLAGRGSADFLCIRKWIRPNHVRAQPVPDMPVFPALLLASFPSRCRRPLVSGPLARVDRGSPPRAGARVSGAKPGKAFSDA